MSELIETKKTEFGTYELWMTGRQFKTVVIIPDKTNKKGVTLKGETVERSHRYMSAALNSNLRKLFFR
jgi:hypothetical protein